jgi:hypothetical protein
MHSTILAQKHTLRPAPSEQCHVAHRCGCKLAARHTETCGRPRPCCAVVQVDSIEKNAGCKGPHENKSSSRQTEPHHCFIRKMLFNVHATIGIIRPHTSSVVPACVATSEHRNVANRSSCKPSAGNAELSSRPRPGRTVVHVHCIQTGTCRRTHDETSGRRDVRATTLGQTQTLEKNAIIPTLILRPAPSE